MAGLTVAACRQLTWLVLVPGPSLTHAQARIQAPTHRPLRSHFAPTCAAPQDLVALSGAHTVGFAEVGFEQTFVHNNVWRPLDKTPGRFDNGEPSVTLTDAPSDA